MGDDAALVVIHITSVTLITALRTTHSRQQITIKNSLKPTIIKNNYPHIPERTSREPRVNPSNRSQIIKLVNTTLISLHTRVLQSIFPLTWHKIAPT